MKNDMLVLTALDRVGVEALNEANMLLGEWCHPENDRCRQPLRCVPYHWLDREKFHRDIEWLQTLYEKKLEQVSSVLNEMHGQGKSINYWRILAGPSLGSLLTIFWDRWESLAKAVSESRGLSVRMLSLEWCKQVPVDHIDLLVKGCASHEFNQLVFQRIAEHKGLPSIRCPVVQVESAASGGSRTNNGRWRRAFGFIRGELKKYSPKQFVSSRKIIFFWDHLSFFSRLAIAWRYELFPIGRTPVFEFSSKTEANDLDCDSRKRILQGEKNSDFERFVDENLFDFLPMSLVENYLGICSYVAAIRPKGAVIFTAGGHLLNDCFKTWAAEQVETNGKVLIHSPHGGAVPHKYVDFDHHRRIGVRAKWSDNLESNDVRVFPSILFAQRKFRFGRSGDKLTIVGYEGPLYIARPENAAWSSLTLVDFTHQEIFIDALSSLPRAALNIRPYPSRGWDHKKRFSARYGDGCLSDESNFFGDINRSRIVICTYPQTTYLQAMESGRPTLLSFRREFWDFEFPYEAELSRYYEAGLFFEDPVKAAQHVNKHWSTLDEWWGSEEILALRDRFRRTFCYDDSEPIDSYLKAFGRGGLIPR